MILADDGTLSMQTFINGLLFLTLGACVLAIFISAIFWAMGSHGQNPGQELTGKKGFIVSVVAAFLVGALPVIMTFVDERSRDADQGSNITGSAPTGNDGTGCTQSDRQMGTHGC